MGAPKFEWRGDQRTSGDNFDHDEDDIYADNEGDDYDDDDDDAGPLGRFEFKQVTGGTWCGNGISAADGHCGLYSTSWIREAPLKFMSRAFGHCP